jgi:hypothetical protein
MLLKGFKNIVLPNAGAKGPGNKDRKPMKQVKAIDEKNASQKRHSFARALSSDLFESSLYLVLFLTLKR